MSRSWLALALVSCAMLVAAAAGAQQRPAADTVALETLIQEGLEAYAQGLEGESRDARLEGFRRAELLFAEASDRGARSAALYTNLGNAALQAEHLGRAVLAYRRALSLAPGNLQASQNLTHARKQLPQWVPTPSEGGALDSFFFWHRSVSYDERALLASLCFLLTALLAAPAIVRRSTGLRNAALLPLLVFAVLVASLAFDPARSAAPEGVVVVGEVVARAADSANAPLRFAEPLPGGTEVRILEDRGSWLQVGLHNGRNAWVSASSVERVAAGDTSS